jgi:hypothetical protein
MKKAAIVILAICLVKILFDLAVHSGMWYLPLLWIIVIIIPVFYLLVAKAAKHNLVYILAYATLTLLMILAQAVFSVVWGVESDTYLLYSSSFLVFAQLGVWAQYYFTRHQVSADALSLGIEFPAEKSASIRALIQDGRIEEAVEQLTAGEELNQEQKVVVTNFSFRFTKVNEQEAMGLMTTEEVSVAKNRIVNGILRYV